MKKETDAQTNEGASASRRQARPPRPRHAPPTPRPLHKPFPRLQMPLPATREWHRFLLHLGIPRTRKTPECVFESLRNSFSHFFICRLRTRVLFAASGYRYLESSFGTTQPSPARACAAIGASPKGPQILETTPQSMHALMAQRDIYLERVTEG